MQIEGAPKVRQRRQKPLNLKSLQKAEYIYTKAFSRNIFERSPTGIRPVEGSVEKYLRGLLRKEFY